MASYTIPFLFNAGPEPGNHFSLNVPDARNNPNSTAEFAAKTWTSCTQHDYTSFRPYNPKKGSTPSVKDVISSWRTNWGARLKSLDRFSLLPFELKDKIWESCLEPQTHTVVCLVDVDVSGNRILSKTWLLESPGKKNERRALAVPLFHICRQSRAVALRFYRRLDPGVYFSPMMDTLRLRIISQTTFTRHHLGNGEIAYRPAGGDRFPGFAAVEILERMGTSSSSNDNAKTHYFYRPQYGHWTWDYRHTHQQYGPPYLFSRIPHDILRQVQNLHVLFHYAPYKPINHQRIWDWYMSQLDIYFLVDDCPVLDLTGLRNLVLKVARFTTQPQIGPDLGLLSLPAMDWSRLVHEIIALPPTSGLRKKDRARGLHQLQSL